MVNMIVSGQPTDTVLDDPVAAVLDEMTVGIGLPDTSLPMLDLGMDGDTEVGAEILAVPAAPVAPATVVAPTGSWEAHQVVTEIYQTHYRSLVRLALLLVHDVPTAEEVVQDSFEAMHKASRRLPVFRKPASTLKKVVATAKSAARPVLLRPSNHPVLIHI